MKKKKTSSACSAWYEEWFNSPYYHILYKDRNFAEAEGFIRNLNELLRPDPSSKLLDAACGKGRHALYLANLGYNVDGFDLSPNNVRTAKQYETDQLKFFINDIRNPLNVNHYDLVFNLFTSFGYFDSKEENQLAINALSKSLKVNGTLVLDFMNCHKVINELPLSEEKKVNNITFAIEKQLKQDKIVKQIAFRADNQDFKYEEQVKVILKPEFDAFFKEAGLEIEHVFGDYDLSTFDENNSDRLIFIARKQ